MDADDPHRTQKCPASAAQPVLSIRGARKRFGATEALRGVDLSLGAGEWLALLGPNGAGKSTLVRAISRLVTLDAGRVTLLGRDLASSSPREASQTLGSALGLVPQDIALYPRLTALENLRAWGRLQGVARQALNQRVAWALDWTGLAARRDDRVETFSGGMKRRLNIACAVLHEPKVLLLDEPTVGVDPQSRQRIWEMLATLREAGTSLLLTTHQLDEAQQMSDRIVIIDQGTVIADGTFEELVRDTIGTGRRVHVRLAAERTRSVPDASSVATFPQGLPDGVRATDDQTLEATLTDVAAELPQLLQELSDHGLQVSDLDVASPSLQAVFIHLTGRELRE